MSTTSSPYMHAKYRRKSMDVFDELMSSSPASLSAHYRSSPSSSSPILPRLPRLSTITPLSTRTELPFPQARIQTSPGLGFEIGLHDVEDDNEAVSPGWSPYRNNGGPEMWKRQGAQRERIGTNVSLPSFRASFSPSDDSEPPLTSDFDVSEYSEDMDVDVLDLSDEEATHKNASYNIVDDENTDDEEIDVIDDYPKRRDVSYSTSAQRGLAPKLTRHDSAALNIADILLQFHDQPRLANSEGLEQPRPAFSSPPDSALASSEESPVEVSHDAGYEVPPSPLSPLPPSSPAMSPMSTHVDLSIEASVEERRDDELPIVPLDPLLPLASSLSKPSQVMSVHMLLQPAEPVPAPPPVAKVVEDEPKPAPAAKQPLTNKQNQPHPGSQANAAASSSTAMDLDIDTSDLTTFSQQPAASTSTLRNVETVKEVKARPLGSSVKVTKVVRVKKREAVEETKVSEKVAEKKEEAKAKKVAHDTPKESAARPKHEKRKSVSLDDGLKQKSCAPSTEEEDESEVRKKKRVRKDTVREASTPRAVSVKPKQQSEAPPESVVVAPPETKEKPTPASTRSVSPPQASSSKTTSEPQQQNDGMSSSEMEGLLIETFAMSRASSMPPSSLYKAAMQSRPSLKAKLSKVEWVARIESVLADARERCGVFERVESSGKDNSDRPLEAQWFYVPERDEDQERAELIRSMMPRLEKRKETRKYKQYYWQPLDKMSKWDPEDEM